MQLSQEKQVLLINTDNKYNDMGSGIGLGIAKLICKVLNHQFVAESNYGKGSDFSIFIESIKLNEFMSNNLLHPNDAKCFASDKTVIGENFTNYNFLKSNKKINCKENINIIDKPSDNSKYYSNDVDFNNENIGIKYPDNEKSYYMHKPREDFNTVEKENLNENIFDFKFEYNVKMGTNSENLILVVEDTVSIRKAIINVLKKSQVILNMNFKII